LAIEYKELIAWQKAIELVVDIYHESSSFPRDESFGLCSQLRRAAVSIPSNIAEGQGRGTKAEFKRFLLIANGSRQEVETQIIIAERLGYFKKGVCERLLDKTNEVGRIIRGLNKSI